MFLVCAIGAIAVSLLPETLGATLPETLDEASVFGKDDKFFSFLPSKYFMFVVQYISLHSYIHRTEKATPKKYYLESTEIHSYTQKQYINTVTRIPIFNLHNLRSRACVY